MSFVLTSLFALHSRYPPHPASARKRQNMTKKVLKTVSTIPPYLVFVVLPEDFVFFKKDSENTEFSRGKNGNTLSYILCFVNLA